MNHVAHRHAVDRSQLLSDGEDVQQGLSGMLPDTIASIDHRLTAMTGRALRRSHVHKILKTHLQTKQASKNTTGCCCSYFYDQLVFIFCYVKTSFILKNLSI